MFWLLAVYIVVIVSMCVIAGYVDYQIEGEDVSFMILWSVFLAIVPPIWLLSELFKLPYKLGRWFG